MKVPPSGLPESLDLTDTQHENLVLAAAVDAEEPVVRPLSSPDESRITSAIGPG